MSSQQQPIPTSRYYGAEIAASQSALQQQTMSKHTSDAASLAPSTSTLASRITLIKDKLHHDKAKKKEPVTLSKEVLSGQVRIGI